MSSGVITESTTSNPRFQTMVTQPIHVASTPHWSKAPHGRLRQKCQDNVDDKERVGSLLESSPRLMRKASAVTNRIPAIRYVVAPVRARTRPSVFWRRPSSNTNPMAVRITAAMKKLRSHRKKVWLGGVPPLGPPRIMNITTPTKLATKPKTKKKPAER